MRWWLNVYVGSYATLDDSSKHHHRNTRGTTADKNLFCPMAAFNRARMLISESVGLQIACESLQQWTIVRASPYYVTEWQRCVTNRLINHYGYKRCLFCARVSTYSAEESSESILLGGGGPFCLGGPLPSGGPGPPLEPPLPPSLPPLGPSFFDPFLPFLGRSSSESSLGQKFEKFKLLIWDNLM